ncbi:hypothetical protein lerEdw1_015581 [Lerista edwardsae]|nr:hypothetical protein lerEdw1_015581 [Lerista edwardsae]
MGLRGKQLPSNGCKERACQGLQIFLPLLRATPSERDWESGGSPAPPLEKSDLFAPLEQGQEAWAPHLQSGGGAAAAATTTGPEVLLEKRPVAGTWWNSYRSPVNVHSDSSSSDDESSSEKEEERNVQERNVGPRITKPRAPLLGKCDSGDRKAEPCNGPGSQLQSCLGVQFHASENNGDLLGNSQQITDDGEIQNVCLKCGKSFGRKSTLKRHVKIHGDISGNTVNAVLLKMPAGEKTLPSRIPSLSEIHTLMQVPAHICLFCGKTFPTNDSLNRHNRIHMETRSYQCSICEKAFGTKYSLRRHLEMHAKRSPGHSSNGGKDPGSSSALTKDQSSDTEENSINWSDSSTLSGHLEVHLEEKNPDCYRSMNDSGLFEPQEAHLGKRSAKRLSFDRAFRDGSELAKDQASHAGGHFNNLCDNSDCSGHWEVHTEENPFEHAESRGSSALPQPHSAHSEENSTEWLEGDKIVTAGSVLIKDQLGHTEEHFNELTENSVFLGQQGALVEDNAPECSENGANFLAISTPIKHHAHREENSVRGLGGPSLKNYAIARFNL